MSCVSGSWWHVWMRCTILIYVLGKPSLRQSWSALLAGAIPEQWEEGKGVREARQGRRRWCKDCLNELATSSQAHWPLAHVWYLRIAWMQIPHLAGTLCWGCWSNAGNSPALPPVSCLVALSLSCGVFAPFTCQDCIIWPPARPDPLLCTMACHLSPAAVRQTEGHWPVEPGQGRASS